MKKSTQTKERILEKTMEIVAEKGYSATSTKEIAEKAGVSEATVFKYYGSKDELLKTIVLRTIDKFYDYSLKEAIPDTFERSNGQSVEFLIQELIKERITFFQKNSPAFRVIFQEMLINDSIFQLFKDKIWTKMRELSNFVFDQGKTRGELREIDNYFLRKAFFGMIIFSAIFENILKLEDDQHYTQEEQNKAMLDILFHGIKEE